MNFSLFGRPGWQHADAKVRAKAVADVSSQQTLGELALGDPDAAVRRAAFQRITEQALLAEISLGESEFNAEALAKLSDLGLITAAAVGAKSAAVRCDAVCRLDDLRLIQRISAQDDDATVRKFAKMKLSGPETLNGFLKSALEGLQIAERKAADVANYCGDLDGIFVALGRDSRFRVNGVLTEVKSAELLRANRLRTEPDDGLRPENDRMIELLANKVAAVGTVPAGRADVSHFRIKIRRVGLNEFGYRVDEHHPAVLIRPAGESFALASGGGDGSRAGQSNPEGFSAGLAVAR